jgi:hypothetical protein
MMARLSTRCSGFRGQPVGIPTPYPNHLVKGISEPGSAVAIELGHPIMRQWWSEAYRFGFSGGIIALAQ